MSNRSNNPHLPPSAGSSRNVNAEPSASDLAGAGESPPRRKETKPYGKADLWLASFELGERRYVESSLEFYARDMRRVIPFRRKASRNMRFRASAFTAVSASKLGDVRVLICVVREV